MKNKRENHQSAWRIAFMPSRIILHSINIAHAAAFDIDIAWAGVRFGERAVVVEVFTHYLLPVQAREQYPSETSVEPSVVRTVYWLFIRGQR